MNKQALAFFSMFTLVLMLSIYYVSLEPLPIESQKNQVETVMLMMKNQNDEQRELLILDLKSQLASTTISEVKKVEILSKIDHVENNKKLEDKILEVFINKSIKSVVFVDDNIISINVFEIEESSKKAEEIMNDIYKLIPSNHTIEVIFS